MILTLLNIVEALPLKFIKGDSDVLKKSMLKDDNEFLRFRGKEQFDKKVKILYPDIKISCLYPDYLFNLKKSYSVRRLCHRYEELGDKLVLKFKYQDSIDDSGEIVGKEFKALDGVVKSVKDEFWNKYLPPNFPHDMCFVEYSSFYEITSIPNDLPGNSFECDLNKLFLSKITPKKNEYKKQNFEDTEKMFSSFGIDIIELMAQVITEKESISDKEKEQLRQILINGES